MLRFRGLGGGGGAGCRPEGELGKRRPRWSRMVERLSREKRVSSLETEVCIWKGFEGRWSRDTEEM